jgi:hypothetical protein
MVTRLNGGNAFAYRFDDSGAFMAEDDGKGSFGIFAAEGVGVYGPRPLVIFALLERGDDYSSDEGCSISPV